MTQVVQDNEGRVWEVRSKINWSWPATAQEFEHDMAGGYVSGIAMLGVFLALVLFVLFWTPSGVVVPGWLVLLFLLVLMLLPMRWMLRLPWTIVADTVPTGDAVNEHWVGTVRGLMAARQDTRQVVRCLQAHAVPNDSSGPLQKVK